MEIIFLFLRLLIMLLAYCSLVVDAQSAKRVALIISNAKYEHFSTLPNPPNDAQEIAQALREAGFDNVELVYDLTREALSDELQKFSSAAVGSEIALIYYAGHGVEVDGTNYLVPVDATLLQTTSVSFEAIPLDMARTAVSSATGLRMVILDACRNNPFKLANANGKRGGGRGLRAIEAEASEFIAYSAKEGTTAQDGPPQGNSPFAKSLAEGIRMPGLEVRLLFGKVRDDVLKTTNKMQEPFTYASLGGKEVYLNPPVETAPKVAEVAPVQSGIRDAWTAVANSANIPALIGFQKLYANHPEFIVYGPLIDQKLEEIKQARQVLVEQQQSAAQSLADEKLRQLTKDRETTNKLLQEQKAAEILEQQKRLAKEKAEREQLAKAAALEKREIVRQKEESLAKQAAEILAQQKKLAEETIEQERLARVAELEAKQEEEKRRKEAQLKLASLEPNLPNSDPATPLENPVPVVTEDAATGDQPEDNPQMVLAIQSELKRLGCFNSTPQTTWSSKAEDALEKYGTATGEPVSTDVRSDDLLAELQAQRDLTLCNAKNLKSPKNVQQFKPQFQKRKQVKIDPKPSIGKRSIIKRPRFMPRIQKPKQVQNNKKLRPKLTPAPRPKQQIKIITRAPAKKTMRCTTLAWSLVDDC